MTIDNHHANMHRAAAKDETDNAAPQTAEPAPSATSADAALDLIVAMRIGDEPADAARYAAERAAVVASEEAAKLAVLAELRKQNASRQRRIG